MDKVGINTAKGGFAKTKTQALNIIESMQFQLLLDHHLH